MCKELFPLGQEGVKGQSGIPTQGGLPLSTGENAPGRGAGSVSVLRPGKWDIPDFLGRWLQT